MSAKTEATNDREILEQIISDICFQLHRHEVQYWKDAPGTDEERRIAALKLAREALHIVRKM